MALKVLVIGAGAVGAYYGGRLAQAGAVVSVVARSDYDTVHKQGYQIKSVDGDFHFTPHAVYAYPSEAGQGYDVIINSLKVLPEIDQVFLLRPVVDPHTVLLLLQNGINIEESIAQAFPQNEILSGLAFVCVTRTAAGRIYHQDYGHLSLGRYKQKPTETCRLLAGLWETAGVQCRVAEDIQKERWKKLCWNAPFNPLSVITGGKNTSQILNDPVLAHLVREIMREVLSLSQSDGHPFNPEHIEQQIEATLAMSPYKPSMLLDYENHRPMEVDAILGNALIAAEQYQVTVPRLETLYALLRSLNSG